MRKNRTYNQNIKIPFDENGNLLTHVYSHMKDIQWLDNKIFTAKLQFKGFGFHARATMLNVDNSCEYSMPLGKFEELLLDVEYPIYPGCIFEREWTFYKQGNAYCLAMIKKEDKE